ncbi:hypothetical protein FJT64_000080 [Amphibalanus amphitrite]|uniref:Uncharacterized protein n=1 Tax=Amphibalanus amphitrite TaxID=1232801 RepID=A0A6A4XHX6_AMPAM|nr:hypothetical protein FJT64_000080 [Amphibalanus amphitrite]
MSDTLVSVVQRGAGGSSVRLQSADTALSDRAGGDGAEVAGAAREWSVSVAPGVAADTISHLADLARTVPLLEIYDCPDLTTGSLKPLTRCPELQCLALSGGVPDTVSLEPLTRCPGLHWLTLSGGVPDTVSLEPLTRCRRLRDLTLYGGVPDAVLDSLSGCPRLEYLTLGDLQRPAETAFTAAAVSRLVKSCRKLDRLYLHCTADTTRAVLTALKKADLGRDSDGRPRIIWLWVPAPDLDELGCSRSRPFTRSYTASFQPASFSRNDPDDPDPDLIPKRRPRGEIPPPDIRSLKFEHANGKPLLFPPSTLHWYDHEIQLFDLDLRPESKAYRAAVSGFYFDGPPRHGRRLFLQRIPPKDNLH